jgi:hypothetical protein
VAAATGACGSDRTGGPRGLAVDVVAAAPAATRAAGSARFEVAVPTTGVAGEVDLEAGREDPDRPFPSVIPEHARPLAAVALVAGAVEVEPYGGQGIRGVSTFRYEVEISPERAARLATGPERDVIERLARSTEAPTIFGDLWIDSEGRLARVQIPLDPEEARPRGDSKATVKVVTVDLFDYQEDQP